MTHYYEYLLDLPIHLLADSYEYIKRSDSAHNEEHIRAVVREASYLCDLEGDGFERGTIMHRAIITAALCHDLGCSVKGGRDMHEVYSAQIFLGLSQGYQYSHAYKMVVQEAILQHRASYKGIRSSISSKIIAAADRGRPNAAVLFMRAYVYTKEVNDVDHDTAVRHAIDYNIAKYGYNGYARMQDNPVIREYYLSEAIAIEEEFENSTVDYVESCLERFALC